MKQFLNSVSNLDATAEMSDAKLRKIIGRVKSNLMVERKSLYYSILLKHDSRVSRIRVSAKC